MTPPDCSRIIELRRHRAQVCHEESSRYWGRWSLCCSTHDRMGRAAANRHVDGARKYRDRRGNVLHPNVSSAMSPRCGIRAAPPVRIGGPNVMPKASPSSGQRAWRRDDYRRRHFFMQNSHVAHDCRVRQRHYHRGGALLRDGSRWATAHWSRQLRRTSICAHRRLAMMRG